jgi:hypothetical protein
MEETMSPQNTPDAARAADDFLRRYTLRPEYNATLPDGDVRRMYAQYVEPDGAGVHVEFSVDLDGDEMEDAESDPVVQALAAQAVVALRRAERQLAAVPIRVTFG